MSIAGQFIAELQRERRSGNVALETEQHLKHEFRKLGWNAPDPTLATAIGVKIDRLTSLPTLTCAASIVGCNSNSDRKETPTGP